MLDSDWLIIIEFLHAASWCALSPRPPPATPVPPPGAKVLFILTKNIYLLSAPGPARGPRGRYPPSACRLAPKQVIARQPVQTDQSQAFKFFSNLISYSRISAFSLKFDTISKSNSRSCLQGYHPSCSPLHSACMRYASVFRDGLPL